MDQRNMNWVCHSQRNNTCTTRVCIQSGFVFRLEHTYIHSQATNVWVCMTTTVLLLGITNSLPLLFLSHVIKLTTRERHSCGEHHTASQETLNVHYSSIHTHTTTHAFTHTHTHTHMYTYSLKFATVNNATWITKYKHISPTNDMYTHTSPYATWTPSGCCMQVRTILHNS